MASRIRCRKGMTTFEAIFTLCLIGILIGVVVQKYQRVMLAAQESALKTGLANIRMSIKLFRLLNNRNPNDLKELVKKEVILPGKVGKDRYTASLFKQKYLTEQATDAKGNIVDAFGNLFSYDAGRGEVKPTTKGYENW